MMLALNESKPDLVLTYKADVSRSALLFLAGSAPLWAIWMPWVIFTLVQAMASEGWNWKLLGLAAFLAVVIVCAIANIFVCKDVKIVVGRRGIRVPVRFVLHTLGATRLDWQDLKAIAFQKNGKPSPDASEICLRLRFGRRVPLRMDGLLREDIPKVILAVQAYAPNAEILPRADVIKGIPINQLSAPVSFTRIWEDDLNSRFGSTIFVPLVAGAKLQSGRVEVVGQMAFGGLSAIYLVKIEKTRLAVLKEAVLPEQTDQASKAKALELFDREAKLLISLHHPRIAQVIDHFVEKGRHYILLQYIEGKDLRTYIKENGPAAQKVVVRWAKEIAEILVYLHGLDPPIIHRDLTPDNLVLARDGSICLIDFGAANSFMGTATGTLVGKQSYIPPEQFRGKATPESDLYAFGGTLYYLLTGKDPVPLAACNPSAARTGIDAQLDQLVRALTEQEVADRAKPASEVLRMVSEINIRAESPAATKR